MKFDYLYNSGDFPFQTLWQGDSKQAGEIQVNFDLLKVYFRSPLGLTKTVLR